MQNNIVDISNNGLLKTINNRVYVELHDDFLTASKNILKSAVNLIETDSGKIILPLPNSKFKIIKLNSNPLTQVEQFLIRKCFISKTTFKIDKYEKIQTGNGKLLGKAQQPYLISPIIVEKNVLGVIFLEKNDKSLDFQIEDISLISAFSNTFGKMIFSSTIDKENSKLMVSFTSNLFNVIENLYLYKNYLKNNTLLAEIIKVSKMINSTLDIDSLLETIMESAKLVLKAEGSSLMLLDKKTNELYFNVITGENQEHLKEIRVPFGKGIAGMVAKNRKSMIVNNAQEDTRVYKVVDEHTNFVTRNLIASPLLVRNKVIGVIEVINSIGRNDFSENDLELFNTFSDQAALAIDNRELIDSLQEINQELKKKVHELSSLHEIGKTLISTLNEKDLFDSIVRIISDELQADRVSLMIYDETDNTLEVISEYGLNINPLERLKVKLSGSLSGHALEEDKIIYTNNLEESQFAKFRNDERYHTGSCIVHPLIQDKEKYGVINISERNNGEGFTSDDFRLISTIASQIMKGIQNFRLVSEMMEKRAYEKELEITSSIQQSILPTKKLDSDEFTIGLISASAKLMGGDFYDYFHLGSNDYSFSIADVSGKSLPAALFMAVSSSIIRTIGKEHLPPEEVLYKANDLIYQNSESGMFVTLFFTNYNTVTHELYYASAGHNKQIIFRHDTREIEFLYAKGSPLGVVSSDIHGPFGAGKAYLRPGDILILYTDGVVEAINEKKEEFGDDRFVDLIDEHYLLSADQMAKRIYREITDFAGAEPQFDDFTLMVIKIQK